MSGFIHYHCCSHSGSLSFMAVERTNSATNVAIVSILVASSQLIAILGVYCHSQPHSQGRIQDFLSAGANSPHPYRGISRIQTGFLVGRFVFTSTHKVVSKTFKEANHTDAVIINCHNLLWFKLLVYFFWRGQVLSPLPTPRPTPPALRTALIPQSFCFHYSLRWNFNPDSDEEQLIISSL